MSSKDLNASPAVRLSLVCEDRDTGKKCQFKDLRVTLQSDNTFKIQELVSKNTSLHYFLNNCMIFEPSDDIDIMIGFYPSEEIQDQSISFDPSLSTLSLKFEKIYFTTQERKTIDISNQNEIIEPEDPKSINTPSSMLKGNQDMCIVSDQSVNIPAYEKLPDIQEFVVSSNQMSGDLEDEIKEEGQKEREFGSKNVLGSKEEQSVMISHEDPSGIVQTQITKYRSSSKSEESREQSKDVSGSFNEEEEDIPLKEQFKLVNEGSISEEEGGGCDFGFSKLLQKQSQQNTQNTSLQMQKTQSDGGEPSGVRKMGIVQNSKPQQGLGSGVFGHYSSFQAYNPLGSGCLQREMKETANSALQVGNSLSQMSRQSRNKERTIREAIEMVTKWRDLQEEYRQKHQVKGLQEVANELNISKKVLDYYFQELRTAEFFGFDFDGNLGNKMGVLRKFIDEQKKNQELKNKNFKITRNLQFKYRLKDNSDALSTTSSHKSRDKHDKLQYKVQDKHNLKNNVQFEQLEEEIPQDIQQSVNSFQEVLSKNSPIFLQYLNTSTLTPNSNTNANANSIFPFNPNYSEILKKQFQNTPPSTTLRQTDYPLQQQNIPLQKQVQTLQPQQTQNSSQSIDKAMLLLELLNQSTSGTHETMGNNQQLEDILGLMRLFSQTSEESQPGNPKSYCPGRNTFAEEPTFPNKRILIKPQKIADVIQIRKSDN